MTRLAKSFYNKGCKELSKALLGQYLVRKYEDGSVVRGKIVECEAYLGVVDQGCHSYKQSKPTEKTTAMFMDPGTAYVYYSFGVHTCFNISAKEEGAAVLIRSIEPIDGIEKIRETRKQPAKTSSSELCSGPAKITQAFGITKENTNKQDLSVCEHLWLEGGKSIPEAEIVVTPRVKMDPKKAGEWAEKKLRFYILGNESVNSRDVQAEVGLTNKNRDGESNSASGSPPPKGSKNKKGSKFFDKKSKDLAKALLGQVLVRKLANGTMLKGYIIEADSYPEDGEADSATDSTAAKYMPGGTVFVYNNYANVYMCVSAKEPGAVVQLRAVYPTEGIDEMKSLKENSKSKYKATYDVDLTSGPTRVTLCFNVDKTINKVDLAISSNIWVESGIDLEDSNITVTTDVAEKGSAKGPSGNPTRFSVKNYSIFGADGDTQPLEKRESSWNWKKSSSDSGAVKRKSTSDVELKMVYKVASGAHKRIGKSFYEQDCESLSKALLGQVLTRKLSSGEVLRAMIVETEAYLGEHDKAAHSYGKKKTDKNTAMFMDPGTIYVYHIYGSSTCINISSQGEGCAVLIRAVDPIEGIDTMRANRAEKKKGGADSVVDKDIGSGPSKLTQAMGINKADFNKKCITQSDTLWLEEGVKIDSADIVSCARVGIDYAGDWKDKPLRFYVQENKSVSVRDKSCEAKLESKSSK